MWRCYESFLSCLTELPRGPQFLCGRDLNSKWICRWAPCRRLREPCISLRQLLPSGPRILSALSWVAPRLPPGLRPELGHSPCLPPPPRLCGSLSPGVWHLERKPWLYRFCGFFGFSGRKIVQSRPVHGGWRWKSTTPLFFTKRYCVFIWGDLEGAEVCGGRRKSRSRQAGRLRRGGFWPGAPHRGCAAPHRAPPRPTAAAQHPTAPHRRREADPKARARRAAPRTRCPAAGPQPSCSCPVTPDLHSETWGGSPSPAPADAAVTP